MMGADVFSLPDKELRRAAKDLKETARWFSEVMHPVPRWEFAHLAARSRVPLIEIWRSRRFLCQIFDHGEVERLSVNRCEIDTSNRRWRDGITWDDLQQVKMEIGRGARVAVEIFPSDDCIVNVANLRHLWCWKAEPPLPFMWRKEAP